jgi:glycosyltransferase involved in cell wall biosynthesis
VRENRVSVIPYGINNAVPNSALTPRQAKQQFGIADGDKTILFFGQIAPYKGLDYLVDAFETLTTADPAYRLIVAGKPKPGADQYWLDVRNRLQPHVDRGRAILDARYIPDDKAEVYFKAADVLVLPYREIFQSGILFFGYSFGLPVVASDVGSLRDDVIDGKTGFLSRPQDPEDLARTLAAYFDSELFANLETRRAEIREFVTSRHSWDTVAELTRDVYARLQLGTTGSSETGLSHA